MSATSTDRGTPVLRAYATSLLSTTCRYLRLSSRVSVSRPDSRLPACSNRPSIRKPMALVASRTLCRMARRWSGGGWVCCASASNWSMCWSWLDTLRLSAAPSKACAALWMNHRPNSDLRMGGSSSHGLPTDRPNINWFSQSSRAARWRSRSAPTFCDKASSR
ncbi:Uncharacterised protein [Bordetella pertussis]|nr:Uncharacterised protein [Bordetella pertussis]CFT92446.1 Uncharacterised protein [Bordetella pertussis]CFV99758.1 Uncharacterised protein [Bordetella pertussis]CFW49423.1 Uncharacterised protein [Bordetella pertussis]